MTHSIARLRAGLALTAVLALTGCDDFDYDLRGNTGGFTTAPAALQATAARPAPDNRGVISYPTYQVALAQRGDTVQDVARRVGLNAQELASFNGVSLDARLRQDEVIALPKRVAEPSPATGAATTGPIRPPQVDVTTLAGQAIDNAADTPTQRVEPSPQTGQEPVRHKVTRGETAYSIARLYNVPVRSLARWNGLGPQFSVREGQFLMIPVAEPAPETSVRPTAPGEGSPTPTPPSAEKPLPEDNEITQAEAEKPAPKPDLGPQTKPANAGGQFAFPVQGTIIREYVKGRNDGINIKAAPGTPVKAAEIGTVAAITESAQGVPIIVIRHSGNLLTVYANVTDVSVEKGDRVQRGQNIAKLRDGEQAYVQFEVRDGFESVDPNDYLE